MNRDLNKTQNAIEKEIYASKVHFYKQIYLFFCKILNGTFLENLG